MGPFTVSWVPLLFHGSLYCFMGPFNVSWVPLLFHGFLYCFMGPFNVSWVPLMFHGSLYCFMGPFTVSWAPLLFHGSLYCFMGPFTVSWVPLLFHGRPLPFCGHPSFRENAYSVSWTMCKAFLFCFDVRLGSLSLSLNLLPFGAVGQLFRTYDCVCLSLHGGQVYRWIPASTSTGLLDVGLCLT